MSTDRRTLNAEIRRAHHERQLGKPHGPSTETLAKLTGTQPTQEDPLAGLTVGQRIEVNGHLAVIIKVGKSYVTAEYPDGTTEPITRGEFRIGTAKAI